MTRAVGLDREAAARRLAEIRRVIAIVVGMWHDVIVDASVALK